MEDEYILKRLINSGARITSFKEMKSYLLSHGCSEKDSNIIWIDKKINDFETEQKILESLYKAAK